MIKYIVPELCSIFTMPEPATCTVSCPRLCPLSFPQVLSSRKDGILFSAPEIFIQFSICGSHKFSCLPLGLRGVQLRVGGGGDGGDDDVRPEEGEEEAGEAGGEGAA